MESIARFQYPQMVWREGEKFLWNPIHRKALKNRPEERVRLRIIEYLLSAGWSKNRISTEEALKNYTRHGSQDSLRTDIICYSTDFEPRILVECKSEHVSLTEKTAEQVARYNRDVQAPYLLLTNGIEDYWYEIAREDRKAALLEEVPQMLSTESDTDAEYRYEYWTKRGFAGTSADPELRKWLSPLIHYFYREEPSIRYLQFKKSPSELNLSNYYHIVPAEQMPNAQIALGFLGTAFGGSRIIGILNSEGRNKAVAEINLDLIFEDEKPNTSVYAASGIEHTDASTMLKNLASANGLLALLESLFARVP